MQSFTKYKAKTETAATVKGNAKKLVQAFINGNNLVTKFQVRVTDASYIFIKNNKSFIFMMESLVFLGNDRTTNNKFFEFALFI